MEKEIIKVLDGRTKIDIKAPNRYPKLVQLINDSLPYQFNYNRIRLNYNNQMTPHRHNTNIGLSMGYVFGDFEGGELVVKIPNEKEYESYEYKNIWFKFDARALHHVNPFIGNRYSIILYTH